MRLINLWDAQDNEILINMDVKRREAPKDSLLRRWLVSILTKLF